MIPGVDLSCRSDLVLDTKAVSQRRGFWQGSTTPRCSTSASSSMRSVPRAAIVLLMMTVRIVEVFEVMMMMMMIMVMMMMMMMMMMVTSLDPAGATVGQPSGDEPHPLAESLGAEPR
jgi:hypothetical protein